MSVPAYADPAGGILDNPLFVKHVRSRFRFPQLMPALVITAIVGGIALWSSFAVDKDERKGVFAFFLGLQGFVLVLVGAGQVAQSISHARQLGILDFHRVSPLPPSRIAVGFLFGAPIREYAIFAATLPFSLALSVVPGGPGSAAFLSCTVLLLLNAVLIHTVALVTSLSAKVGGRMGGATVAPVAVLYLIGMNSAGIGFALPGMLTAVPGVAEALGWAGRQDVEFFGLELPFFAQSFLYQVPLAVMLFATAVRKTRSDRAHACSKAGALAFLVVLAFLGMAACWNPDVFRRDEDLTLDTTVLFLYGAAACALLFAVAVTPTSNEFANGVRREKRLGGGGSTGWKDHGTSKWAVTTFAAVLFLAAAVLFVARPHEEEHVGRAFAAIATAALAVAGFGYARQYFELSFPRNSTPYFVLFLFGAWALPLLVAMVIGMTGSSDSARAWMSASPIAGIAGAAAKVRGNAGDAARIVAPLAALLVAVVFRFLCASAESAASARALQPLAPAPEPGHGPGVA